MSTIKSTSKARRNHWFETFRFFLNDVFKYNFDIEKSLALWETKVQINPHLAADYLFCFKKFIENPPEDLVVFLHKEGDINLYWNEDQPDERQFDYLETVEWLRETMGTFEQRFRKIVEKEGFRGSFPIE